MIPHVSADIYKDAVGFKMPLNDFQLFYFVEFSYKVMRLNQIAAIPHKKPKTARIFIGGYENAVNPSDLSDPLCYRKSCGAAQQSSSCALPYCFRHGMMPRRSRELPNPRVVLDSQIPAPNSVGRTAPIPRDE